MRLTGSMLSDRFLADLQRNTTRLGRLQSQLSTNRRLSRLSDDPVGTIKTLNVRRKLADLEQYQRNIADAKDWLLHSETAVLELNEMVKTAFEKTVQAANGAMGEDERQAVAVQIRQLRDHIVQVGNAARGDSYLFGGFQATEPPFTTDAAGLVSYQGVPLGSESAAQLADMKTQAIRFDIGTGLQTVASINGPELLGTGDRNLIQVFDRLIDSLSMDPAGDLGSRITELQKSQTEILSVAADIGGRMNRLELVQLRYEQDELNYKNVKSDVEDIDLAEATMQLKMSEAVYSAALAIGARVIQPSLVDFLR